MEIQLEECRKRDSVFVCRGIFHSFLESIKMKFHLENISQQYTIDKWSSGVCTRDDTNNYFNSSTKTGKQVLPDAFPKRKLRRTRINRIPSAQSEGVGDDWRK